MGTMAGAKKKAMEGGTSLNQQEDDNSKLVESFVNVASASGAHITVISELGLGVDAELHLHQHRGDGTPHVPTQERQHSERGRARTQRAWLSTIHWVRKHGQW